MNGLVWHLHDSPATSVGAIRLSAVVVLCVLAVLFLKEARVEAAMRPVQQFAPAFVSNEAWWMPPATVPNVDWERGAMADGLRAHSDVLGDRWQPTSRTAQVLHRPVETTERPEVVRLVESAAPDVAPAVEITRAAEAVFLREPTAEEPPVHVVQAPAPIDPKTNARIAISSNHFTEALKLLAGSAPRVADDPEHYALLSVVLVALGRFDEAAEIYAALLARNPHDARLWAGLAICQARLGRSGQSIDAYREAKRLAPGDPGVLHVVESGLAGIGKSA